MPAEWAAFVPLGVQGILLLLLHLITSGRLRTPQEMEARKEAQTETNKLVAEMRPAIQQLTDSVVRLSAAVDKLGDAGGELGREVREAQAEARAGIQELSRRMDAQGGRGQGRASAAAGDAGRESAR